MLQLFASGEGFERLCSAQTERHPGLRGCGQVGEQSVEAVDGCPSSVRLGDFQRRVDGGTEAGANNAGAGGITAKFWTQSVWIDRRLTGIDQRRFSVVTLSLR